MEDLENYIENMQKLHYNIDDFVQKKFIFLILFIFGQISLININH